VKSVKSGTVHLVGAGPGDPKLLTMRAHELIASCEVLAYDELVSESILSIAPVRAERIAVGRRACGVRHHDASIHPAIIARALAGHAVVRLKGGDPMIFGRGGEEISELRAANVRYEIVPGITSALGAAASLGFSLTRRGVASGVALRTGHRAKPGQSSEETLVYYMGLASLGEIARELVAEGHAPSTPALVVASATRPEERHVRGTLATIASLAKDAALESPAILFVGEVVGLDSSPARRALRLVTSARARRTARPSAALRVSSGAANHVQFARIDRPAKSVR
jgi:uroporphyrin-III C-methyltransferase